MEELLENLLRVLNDIHVALLAIDDKLDIIIEKDTQESLEHNSEQNTITV